MAKRPSRTKKKSTSRATAKTAPKAPAKSTRSPDVPVLALAVLGMVLTAYLTGVAWWEGSPAFCTEGSGCDIVQQSRWSEVLGLPLAFWGFVLYAVIGLVAFSRTPDLKRWQRLWHLSLVGVAISLYLTQVAAIALNAVCTWCLASLGIMTAIFATVAVRRPSAAPGLPWKTWLINSGVLVVVAVTSLHLYYNSDIFRPPLDARVEPLVEHLNQVDAKFYGASWCPSCQEQKQLFGALADELPYVECSPHGRGSPVALECLSNDIHSYPTWIIDGERIEGVLKPEDLARHSGFDW